MPIVDPVTVINTIKPKNGNNFGLIEDIDLIGGMRVVANAAARDAIPLDKLTVGCFVLTSDNSNLYICTSVSPTSAFSLYTFTGTSPVPVADQYTATALQTVFTLSSAPTVPTATFFFVNGQRQKYGVDFTVSGTTLTFLAPSFSLQVGDDIAAHYFV